MPTFRSASTFIRATSVRTRVIVGVGIGVGVGVGRIIIIGVSSGNEFVDASFVSRKTFRSDRVGVGVGVGVGSDELPKRPIRNHLGDATRGLDFKFGQSKFLFALKEMLLR